MTVCISIEIVTSEYPSVAGMYTTESVKSLPEETMARDENAKHLLRIFDCSSTGNYLFSAALSRQFVLHTYSLIITASVDAAS